jgi:hypothetical protein
MTIPSLHPRVKPRRGLPPAWQAALGVLALTVLYATWWGVTHPALPDGPRGHVTHVRELDIQLPTLPAGAP